MSWKDTKSSAKDHIGYFLKGVCSLRDEVKTAVLVAILRRKWVDLVFKPSRSLFPGFMPRGGRERFGIGEMEDLARIDGSAQQNTTMPHAL